MNSSVSTAPVAPSLTPAETARSAFGLTPSPITTSSKTSSPASVITATPSDLLLRALTGWPSLRSTPERFIDSSRTFETSPSIAVGRSLSIISYSVTFFPRSTRASAASTPMYPPPRTATLEAPESLRCASTTSSGCLNRTGLASSTPSSPRGISGLAPVAITSESHESFSVLPSPSETSTRLPSTSIEVTVAFVRTLILLSEANLSGE